MEQETKPSANQGHEANTMLSADEKKLQFETGCRYGMNDCMNRNLTKVCTQCKNMSKYDWDYTLGTT